MSSFGTLRLLKDDGTHGAIYTLQKEEKCSIGSMITCSIRLYNNDANLRSIHCVIDVLKNGVATLVNKAPKHTVKVNDENVSRQRCLRSGDVVSIFNTRFLYENKKLSRDTIEKTEKQVKHTLLQKEGRKSVRPVAQVKNLAVSMKVKKPHTVVATKKRISSFSGSVGKFVTSRRATNRISTSPLLPSKRLSTPIVQKGMRVHTPMSTNKPSTSTGRYNRKTKMQSFNESCDYDDDDNPRRELKTPVTENVDENSFATPQNNTSLVVVESPIEEEPPVRSKKVKNMSIHRLTQNDDSVIVMGTPSLKTPVAKIGAKVKTPKSALKKSKLMTEILGVEVCTSTPAKRKSVIIVEDTLGDDVSAMSSFTEESIHNSSIGNLSAVEPNISRKSRSSASKSFQPATKSSPRKSMIYLCSKSLPSPTSALEESVTDSHSILTSPMDTDSTSKKSSRKAGRGVKRSRGPDDSLLPAKRLRYKSDTTLDENEFNSSIESSAMTTSPDVSMKRAMTEPKMKKRRTLGNSLPPSGLFSVDVTKGVSKLSIPSRRSKTNMNIRNSRRNTTAFVVSTSNGSIVSKTSTSTGKRARTEPKPQKKRMLRNSLLSTSLFAGGDSKDSSTLVNTDAKLPTSLTDSTIDCSLPLEEDAMQNSLLSSDLSAEVDEFVNSTIEHDIKMEKKQSLRSSIRNTTPFVISDSKNSTFESPPLQTSLPLGRLAMTEPKVQKKRILRKSLPSTKLFTNVESVEGSIIEPSPLKTENNLASTQIDDSTDTIVDPSRLKSVRASTRHTNSFVVTDSKDLTKPSPLKSTSAKKGSRRNTTSFAISDSKTSTIVSPLASSIPMGKQAMTDPKSQKKRMPRKSVPSTILFGTVDQVVDDDSKNSIIEPSPLKSNTTKLQKKESLPIGFVVSDSISSTPLKDSIQLEEQKIQKKRTLRNSQPSIQVADSTLEKSVRVSTRNTNSFDASDSKDLTIESTIPSRNAITEPKVSNKKLPRNSVPGTILFSEVEDPKDTTAESLPSAKTPKKDNARSNRRNATFMVSDSKTTVELSSELEKHAMTDPKPQKKRMPRKSVPSTILFGTVDQIAEPSPLKKTATKLQKKESFVVGDPVDSTPLRDSVQLEEHVMTEPKVQKRRTLRNSLPGTILFSEVEDSKDTTAESLPSAKTPKKDNARSNRRNATSFMVSDSKATVELSSELEKHAMTDPKPQKKRMPRKSVPSTILFGTVDQIGEPSPLKKTTTKLQKKESFVVADSVSSTPLKDSVQLEEHAMTEPKVQKRRTLRNSLPNIGQICQDSTITASGQVSELPTFDSKNRKSGAGTIDDSKSAMNITEESLQSNTPNNSKDSTFELSPLTYSVSLGELVMTEPKVQKKRILRNSLPSTTLFSKDDGFANNDFGDSTIESMDTSSFIYVPGGRLTRSSLRDNTNNSSTHEEVEDSVLNDLSSPKRLSKTPKPQSEPLNDLSSPEGLKRLITPKSQKEPENDLTNPKVVKTPKPQNEPLNDLSSPKGVKKLLRTPKPQKEPENDLSSPKGVKKLLKTPKPVKEPLNDLTNPAGVKQLLKTPKVQSEPLNDLSSPRGVKRLLKTPKLQKDPLNDLSSPRGVKQLMKTPKPQNEPLNDLMSPRGVKQLMKTPKPQREPMNDLSSPRGVKQLMKTPKLQNEPLNDLSSPRGVKQLMKTPKPQNEPLNDLSSPYGVKQLMRSPKPDQKQPENDLSNPLGVKRLMRTPKDQKEPNNDLTNPLGVKRLMRTPKVQNEPENDLTNPLGVKRMMRTPKVQKEPENDLTNPSGVKRLMRTPKVQKEPKNDLTNPLGVKQLMQPVKVQKEPENDLTNPVGLRMLFSPKAQKEPKNDLSEVEDLRELFKMNSNVRTYSRKNTPRVEHKEVKKIDSSSFTNVKNWLDDQNLNDEDESVKTTRKRKVLVEQNHEKTPPKKRTRKNAIEKSDAEEVKENLEDVEVDVRTRRGRGKAGDVEEVNVGTPKRTRGRKKVEETEVQNESTDEQNLKKTEPPRRGRGRRNADAVVSEEKHGTVRQVRGRAKKNEDVDVEVIDEAIEVLKTSSDDQNVVVSKRGRGRKQVEVVEKLETPKRATRARKKVDAASAEVAEVPKRGKGRKKIDSVTEEAVVEDDVIEIVETPPKRGRGNKKVEEVKVTRGKKQVDVVVEVADMEKIVTPRRGRGKKKDEMKVVDEQQQVEKVETQKQGRGRKDADVVEEEVKLIDEDQAEKAETHRRGRGKKKVEELIVIDEQQQVEKVETQKGGRGRKEVDVVAKIKLIDEDQAEKVETPRRGRAKKKVEEVVVIDEQQQVEKVETQKRGRGRKEVDVVDEDQVEKVETPRRGRRKKKVEVVEKIETPRRGRGRKKVDVAEEVEEVKSSGEEMNEVVFVAEVDKASSDEHTVKGRKKAETIEIDVLPVERRRKRRQIKSIEDIQQEALNVEMTPPAPPKKAKPAKKVVEPSPIRKSARTRK